MEPRPHDLSGTTTSSSGVVDGLELAGLEIDGLELDGVVAATADLEAIARDRLFRASNDLAGIATSALPAIQLRLLEVIAELDDLGHDLRRIIIVLRNGRDD